MILEDVDVLIDHGGLDFLITLLNDDNFTLVLLSRIPYEDLIDICNTVPDFPVEKIKYIEFGKHIIITQDDLKGR